MSVLSPYIRHRLITEREVLDRVLQRHSLSVAEKFVQEVFWRGYFKGHLETRPEIWRRYCINRDEQLAAVAQGGLARAYRRAIEGKTGIDCFDAWVEVLLETGYLHNHTRMWFASIWIFTLRLPWELGADFPYRHFIDGDPASNTLSWRWVGGLHTQGQDLSGASRQHLRTLRTVGSAPRASRARRYLSTNQPCRRRARCRRPGSSAPEGPAILLLTEEDLHPESLALDRCEIRGIVACHAVLDRSPQEIGEYVMGFTEGALEDAAAHASSHFGVTVKDRCP